MPELARIRTAVCLAAVAAVLLGGGRAAADPILEPCTGPVDWLQLTSSEWLRGDLRRMRSRTVEFQSEKLKSQTLEWKDVVTVCVAGVARFVRSDRSVVQGIGQVRGDTVSVLAATGEVSFPRDDLLAILPGQATELDRWGLRVGLGADYATGNTNQSSMNFSLEVRREDRVTRGQVGLYGNYGRANGQDTANNQRIDGKLDYFLSRRFYLTLAQTSLVRDPFQNTALRVVPSMGAGYRLFELPGFDCDVELALGYQYLEYVSTVSGRPPSQSDVANRFTTSFDWTIVSDLDLDVDFEVIGVWTSLGQSSTHTKATLSYEITDLFDIDISAVHDRTFDPVANDQGQVPDRDDLRLTVGLAVEIW